MDYKRVLRLHYVNGFSSRAISESTKDGKTTINDFLKRFRESTVLTWPLSEDITNEMIERLLYQKPGNITNDDFYRGFNEEEVHRKLAKKGETLKHLWKLYNAAGEVDGKRPLSYRQYCRRYENWMGNKNVTFHSAVLWYADTNFFGTIIENSIKGLRIRQGNILIGDKGSCSSLFKEERFNGWMIGELHILDPEIIVNSRRDGFEKNSAYYELLSSLRDWALDVSKEIRHLSYERSLSGTKKAVVEAEQIDDISDENDLYSEDLAYAEDYCEGNTLDQGESDELAETDYIAKLGLLLNQRKAQTKYTALNINAKLTGEQRKVLERVFDLIMQEYDRESAERFVNTISAKF